MNTSISNVADLKLSEAVLSLAATVKKEFKIGEGGVIEVAKDFYEKNLPDGITMLDIKKVQEHNTNVVTAIGLSLGELGIEYFKKNKKAEEVSVEFAAGKDKAAVMFQRSKQVPDGAGGTKEKFGLLSASWKMAGAGNRGSFKKVREHLSANTAAVLGG